MEMRAADHPATTVFMRLPQLVKISVLNQPMKQHKMLHPCIYHVFLEIAGHPFG
jgi:hypothetical protein